jgi:hypothetical protein
MSAKVSLSVERAAKFVAGLFERAGLPPAACDRLQHVDDRPYGVDAA